MKFGLLGEHLRHSYSPAIHKELHGEEYRLYEVSPERVGTFLQETDLDGMNVTIPYKKTVMPYCVSLSEAAQRIGCVNTLVRRADGWHGYNTDYTGFCHMLKAAGIDPAGKKALVLGSGGASLTARTALKDLGAKEVVVISRSGEDNYDNLDRHRDAGIIVNTTPAGMFPDNGTRLLDLQQFPQCDGVADVVYNPARTALLLQAEDLSIPYAGGLSMLVAQAKRSAEIWLDKDIPDSEVTRIEKLLAVSMQNIVLIGMPGSGKTSVGKALQQLTGRELIDTDEEIVRMSGRTIPDIIGNDGEEAFRALETAAIAEAGKRSGCIISTGGGCVTRERNYPLLHQNAVIVWIRRRLDWLPTDGRPLSRAGKLDKMYEERKDKYAAFADITIENNRAVKKAAEQILKEL
ncbi:MAG: shikimate kinase [Lachnospiraceae bacterium]|nr:shikimate kinase [Lachnospiraceae bacterium]